MLPGIKIDEDVAKLNLCQLQQLFMKSRNDARKGLKTLMASGNDHCWDDMVNTNLNLVTKEERADFKMGQFHMTPERTLFFCKSYIHWKGEHCSRTPEDEKTPLD